MKLGRGDAKHLLRIAHDPAYRREASLIVISGHHVVNEYAGPRISTVVTESYLARKGQPLTTSFHIAQDSFMQRVTREPAPEGILALIPYPTNLTSTISSEFKRTLMLYNITDPRNLGALSRTALALGWNQLVLFGDKAVDPFNIEAIRCSKGALLKIPRIVRTDDVKNITNSAADNTDVFLAEKNDTSVPVINMNLRNSLLILGSESHGLHDLPQPIRALGIPISINTCPAMPFLSVSAAGAILMSRLRS